MSVPIPDEHSLFSQEVDLSKIFIGREDQLEQFRNRLNRWLSLATGATMPDAKAPPSPNNKIQGLVILLHGRGGFGKSTLLKHYHTLVQEVYAADVQSSDLLDWEFAAQERRTLFNPARGEAINALAYFSFLRDKLASALTKERSDFKEYQQAERSVEEVQRQAHSVLEGLQRDERYSWLRGMTREALLALLCSLPGISGLSVTLSDPELGSGIRGKMNQSLDIGLEKLHQVHMLLQERLGKKFSDYLDPAWRLGKGLGLDLAQLARRHPLLIFFDTYEEIDEGDPFLRMVMGAAGVRVGWVIAGRDNLWGGAGHRRRSLDLEYGYRDLVETDRRLVIDFSADGVGDFTTSDIQTYFAQVAQRAYLSMVTAVSEKEAVHLHDVTEGVPLAVKIAAGLYLERGDLALVTEGLDGKREIVDQMVERYLLHTRTNPQDRARLYGLALLRRAEEQRALAAALDVPDHYHVELSRLHRRYGFIFTRQQQPSLHQEVRHFLRLWLLQHRTSSPDILQVIRRLSEALLTAFQDLEAQRHYPSLRQRLEDDQWVELYLDLADQQCWLDAVHGLGWLLPFMLAASIYRREANREARTIGEFFERMLPQPYRKQWNWANQSLVYGTNHHPLPEELAGLKELVRLASQGSIAFVPPLPPFQEELEAAVWWRLGEAYQGKHPKEAVRWYEKALERLPQESELRETLAEATWQCDHTVPTEEADDHLTGQSTSSPPSPLGAEATPVSPAGTLAESAHATLDELDRAIARDPQDAQAYVRRGDWYVRNDYERAIEDFDRALELDRQNASIYVKRGKVFLLRREYRRAIEDFDYALELEPSNTAAQALRNEAASHLTSTLQPTTLASQRFLRPSQLSRRKVLVSAIGLGLAMGGLIGGDFLLQHSYKPSTSFSSPSSFPGYLLYTYRNHSDNVVGVAWSPDGTRIASASYDHTVQVWDAANGGHIYIYRGHNQRVTCVAWSPDGRRIASGSDDHTVQVWDAANGSHIYTYRGHSADVHSVDWSPDGTRIASASADMTVQVWDVLTGSNVLIYPEPKRRTQRVWTAAWSPDGTRIASASSDSTVQVWDARKGSLLLNYPLHSSRVHHVAWSPDGMRIASGGDDSSVQVWDAQNGRNFLHYAGHNNSQVWTVAWSPDGTRIASGGLDKTVQVWDAQNGRRLLTYRAHSDGVASVAWSPTDARIASGAWDHTVQVWNAPV